MSEERITRTQSEHEAYNASNYPGTRQECSRCGDPTGRCEEDGIFNSHGEPFCSLCAVIYGVVDGYVYDDIDDMEEEANGNQP